MPQLSQLGQHASSSSLRQANVRLWSDSSVMGRAAGQFRLVDLCSMQSVAYSHRREEATGPRAKCMHATVCTNLGSNGTNGTNATDAPELFIHGRLSGGISVMSLPEPLGTQQATPAAALLRIGWLNDLDAELLTTLLDNST